MRYFSKISLVILLIFISNCAFSQEYNILVQDTICYRDSYNNNGFNLTNLNLGMNFDTTYHTSITDEDSIRYLELFVKPTSETLIDVSICHGEDYITNDFQYVQPEVGVIQDTVVYTNVHGCDSLVILDLKVNPVYEKVLWESICYHENYTANGFNVIAPEVGWYYDTLFYVSQGGCDSIVYLDLMVYPVYDTTITASIIYGNDYNDNGFSFTQPSIGVHHDMHELQSIYGCDSVVRLDLIVNPEPIVNLYDTVCQGVDYLLDGFVILHGQPAGIVNDTLFLHNIYGGDSIVCLALTVFPEYDTLYSEFICHGDDYIDHGFTYINPAPGEYNDYIRYETVLGCDSTVRLNLVVHPVIDSLVEASICFGEDYIDNEFLIPHPAVGKVYDTVLVSNVEGCTMFYLDLTVNPVFDTLLFDTICYGSVYDLHGFYLDSLNVGTTIDTLFLQSQYGCDSTVRLQLLVNPVYDTLIVDAICYGEIYDNYGFYLDTLPVGLYNDSLKYHNQYGCDSTIYLQLTVNPVYDTLIVDSICFGNVYDQNGFYFPDTLSVGVYNDTLLLQTIMGCDSVVRLNLTVNPVYDTLFVDNICYGDVYDQHGFYLDSLNVGTINDTLFLQSQHGCDSIVYLQLTVNPLHETNINATLCYGESYNENGFHIVRPAVGMTFDTLRLASQYGCDSTVYLQLTVNPVHDTLFTDHICYGEDYIGHGFVINKPSPGVHNKVLNLENQYGCDSIVRLNLTVYNSYNISLYEDICFGESYTENGFSYINPSVGTYYDTLRLHTIHDCDSIVSLRLTVIPVFDFGVHQIQGFKETYVSTDLQTGRYEYVIEPIEYCNEYKWSVRDNDKWVVEPHGNICVLYVTTPGEYVLEVVAENSCSYTSREYSISSQFYDVEEVSMIEADVYPNPAKDKLIVESEEITGIKVLSLYGQIFMDKQYDEVSKVSVDVDYLPRGAYMVLVETKRGNVYKQVVIER